MGAHIPERQCICCREKRSKYDLIRIVKTDDGFVVDEKGNLPGRGAYLCENCHSNPELIKKRPLDRAFRMRIEENAYKVIWGIEE